MAIIYKITNTINNKIYIGQTTRTLNARWRQHKSRAKDAQYTEYLYNAMRKYGIDNFVIEKLDECDDEDRFHLETEYITKYRTYVGFDDCNGYNLVLSQDGPAPILAQETIQLWNDGLPIVAISDRLHICVKTVSRILKNAGITQDDIYTRRAELTKLHNSKAVIQYTLTGEYVNTFVSAADAGRSINKRSASISKACVGKDLLTAYGFIWQYEADDNVEEVVTELKKHNKVGKNKKKIAQLNENYQIIHIFESASAAGRYFGKAHAGIAYAARNHGTAYGYY
jgi:hypothetical protein